MWVFPCSFSAQRGGTQPLDERSPLSDVGCSRAPPRSSAGIQTCVAMHRWMPCLPRRRSRERQKLGRRRTASQKKKVHTLRRHVVLVAMSTCWFKVILTPTPLAHVSPSCPNVLMIAYATSQICCRCHAARGDCRAQAP